MPQKRAEPERGADKLGGSGAGGKSKRQKAKYLNFAKSGIVGNSSGGVPLGCQGFLVSCVTGKENQAGREIIRILSQFREELPACHAASLQPSTAGRVEGRQEQQATGSGGAGLEAEEEGEDEEGAGRILEPGDNSCAGGGMRRVDSAGATDKAGAQGQERDAQGGVEQGERVRDIDRLLREEVEDIRSGKQTFFEAITAICKSLIFIRMLPGGAPATVTDAPVQTAAENGSAARASAPECPQHSDGAPPTSLDPCQLAEAIMRDAARTGKPKTRYVLRLLPVQVSCYASVQNIARAIEPLIAAAFPPEGCPPKKFAVTIEARAHGGLDKMEVIKAVAALVPAPHSVDLNRPDTTILLQIVKTTCCMAIVPSFKELAKYNLRQLTLPNGGKREGHRRESDAEENEDEEEQQQQQQQQEKGGKGQEEEQQQGDVAGAVS